jgi:hypothetical protein
MLDDDERVIWAALAAPFHAEEVKQRTENGRTYDYITARTAMNRLDNVIGPGNWWDTYEPLGQNTVLCRLTIRLPDGQTLTKCDAGANVETMKDAGDGEKGGLSDGFKRACVKFGISRYLYRDGVPDYADEVFRAAGIDPRRQTRGGPAGPQERQGRPATSSRRDGGDPRDGRALFAWAKRTEQETGWEEGTFVRYLQDWGSEREYPDRIVDWTPKQVAAGVAEGRAAVERSAQEGGDS